MSNESSNLSTVMERYSLSVKLAGISCAVSAALSILVLLAGPVYEWSGFVTFSLTAIPFVLSFVFSVMALIHSKFSESAVRDEEEKVLLQKRKESKTSLLDVSEDVRFTAGRTLLNFEKYIPSTVAILCALLMAAVLVFFWRTYIFRPETLPVLGTGLPKQPMLLAFTSVLCAAVSVSLGIFLAGQSHVFEFRWLRPVGAWLMAGAVLMLFTVCSSILTELKLPHWNALFSKISFFALAILCVELFTNFISEFYRPRNQMEDRPVYESRLLSFFTEPGGVMRNIADSLDYQFGFKVSRTWIYGFMEKSILPAILLWLFLFWIFTSLCEVAPGELGVRERFGSAPKNASVLTPGVYLKMPWPFERIVRVPINVIYQVDVGGELQDEGKAMKPAVVLWTTEHGGADGYLVANDLGGTEVSNAVSVLTTILPISYKVKPSEIHNYAFRFKDIPKILKTIGEQESTRYFASTDFIRDMSSGRGKIVKELQSRIQKETDRLGLGIEIVCVNMTDAHPPYKEVAPAFQEVLAAKEEARGMVFVAKAEEAKLLSEGRIKSLGITSTAAAYKFHVSNVAAADAFRFQRQLTAFNEQPQLFRLRTYLDFLENDCKDLRKYVLSSQMPSQIYEVNMEEKPRLDLLEGADVQNLGK